VLTLPYTMCLLSWATVIGFVRFITRTQEVTWQISQQSRVVSAELESRVGSQQSVNSHT
jgi:hypothetical protein